MGRRRAPLFGVGLVADVLLFEQRDVFIKADVGLSDFAERRYTLEQLPGALRGKVAEKKAVAHFLQTVFSRYSCHLFFSPSRVVEQRTLKEPSPRVNWIVGSPMHRASRAWSLQNAASLDIVTREARGVEGSDIIDSPVPETL